MNRRGFTLIELLAVIVILALLITFGSRTIRIARLRAKKAQAMVEIKSIETAAKAFMNRYGNLPLPSSSMIQHGEGDYVFDFNDASERSARSEAVFDLLTASDAMNEADNPARMVFLEPQGDGSDGVFLDPWGFQYRIALDTDYDGRLDVGGERVAHEVAVAAVGLYVLGNGSDTNDLVKSWE